MNRFRKLKNDDKGMTLVEVIIAITILGIVVVPVLQSLTTSMAYNAKARVRQELTLTAESIMESFKGYGITRDDGDTDDDDDGMVKRFANGIGLKGLLSDDALNGVTYSCTYSTDSVTDADINSSTDVSSLPVDAKYTFTVTGLVSNSQTYDVTITAEPDSTLDVYVPTDAESTKDAVYVEAEDWDADAQTKAAEDFCNDENGYAAALAAYFQYLIDSDTTATYEYYVTDGTTEYMLDEESDVENSLLNPDSSLYIGDSIVISGRTLEFTVDLDSDEYVVTADISCDYYVSGYTYLKRKVVSTGTDLYNNSTVVNTENVGGGTLTFPFEDTSYSANSTYTISGLLNAEIYRNPTTAGLDRLYVYYYPYYDHDDSINISFTSNLTGKMAEFECYILKQRTSTLSSNRTATKESSYHPSVKVENTTGAKVTVFHNYDYNIGNGKSLSSPTIPGTNTTAYGLYSGVSSSDDTTEEETLSYTLDLIVTRQDNTGSQVASLTSTMIEKNQ